ncbi:uncharacterized protein DS421_14g468670 [Arachis hypogaea]|nr:uncharacterized protein DS421_14g468670 [Arachis hypogaea]
MIYTCICYYNKVFMCEKISSFLYQSIYIRTNIYTERVLMTLKNSEQARIQELNNWKIKLYYAVKKTKELKNSARMKEN